MGNDELVSVRERLENLKKNSRDVPKVLESVPDRERRPLGDGMYTFERVFQQKVEKVIKRIEFLKERMEDSENFLNLFYDLKRVENEFLDLLAEAGKRKIDFPDNFNKQIEDIKSQIRQRIR
ncbi:MAG: hypothetical protein Q8O03_03590 [Nanoarchaeota archaeon]|nr:hypothetical protein [Nanoarchaeota archaeon]